MPKKRIRKLGEVNGCQLEMQRIYRACRNGEMDLADGRGYIWMLKQMSGLIIDGDIENRLTELESRLL